MADTLSAVDRIDGAIARIEAAIDARAKSGDALARRHAALKDELVVPMYAGTLAICVGDVLGRSFYYKVAEFGDE
jgi:hypothetical protein